MMLVIISKVICWGLLLSPKYYNDVKKKYYFKENNLFVNILLSKPDHPLH